MQTFDGHCYHRDTVVFANYTNLDFSIGENANLCSGETLVVDATDEFVSYLWHDGSVNQTFETVEGGEISVTVTDINSCVYSDQINITVVNVASVNLGNDTTYCTNVPVILNPNDIGGSTYLWNTNETTRLISVESSGTYWVEVTTIHGCKTKDFITLEIFDKPIVDLGNTIEFCENESDTIFIEEDYETYVWNDGSTLSYIIADQTSYYSVTVTDENECESSDSVYVNEHLALEPSLGNDTTLCDSAIYSLTTKELYHSYLWHDGSTNRTFRVEMPGLYMVTVSDNIGCSATADINIEYVENPIISSTNQTGGRISIEVENGLLPYTYSHDGILWQDDNYFDLLPAAYYTFQIKDANACSASKYVYLEAAIYAPDFFTPNGDGYNDKWEIGGLYHYPSAYITLFDRYGKILYESHGTDFSWDGTYAGKPLSSDTYWYIIELGGEAKPVNGRVSIIR